MRKWERILDIANAVSVKIENVKWKDGNDEGILGKNIERVEARISSEYFKKSVRLPDSHKQSDRHPYDTRLGFLSKSADSLSSDKVSPHCQ